MFQQNLITNLLGIANVFVDKIENNSSNIEIHLSTQSKAQVCPCCGQTTKYIHDYRTQKIRDIPFQGKETFLYLRKRRYVCNSCGKRFFEKYDFLPRYRHFTGRVYTSVITALREKISFKDVGKRFGISSASVFRIFEYVAIATPTSLPTVLGIDEFKGNTNGEKFQVILTNIKDKKVVDILPNRHKSNLITYFLRFPRAEREKVRVLVMDMWENYRALAWLFPNAKVVVDRYHWVRQIHWALDNVRKNVQKNLSDWWRKYFKRHRFLLYKKFADLDSEQRLAVLNMVERNTELYNAWQLKEMFYDFKDCKKPRYARKLLLKFILAAEGLGMEEFKDCLSAMHNWATPILNSFQHKYTNAFTEGTNNSIKVLKRISYGYQRFDRLKKKILFVLAS